MVKDAEDGALLYRENLAAGALSVGTVVVNQTETADGDYSLTLVYLAKVG